MNYECQCQPTIGFYGDTVTRGLENFHHPMQLEHPGDGRNPASHCECLIGNVLPHQPMQEFFPQHLQISRIVHMTEICRIKYVN